MDWKPLLVSITRSVDQELRLRNEYLASENRILCNQISGRIQLSDSARRVLAEIGKKLGKKALDEIATIATSETIFAWHRKCIDQKGHISKPPKSLGRPRMAQEIEDLVVRMARENRSWGYDRIVGALGNLGYTISDQTVGNILKRHSIPPAPERKKTVTWREFIRIHMDVLGATDFFTSEIWRGLGLLMASRLCCIRFGSQHVNAVGRILHQRRHEVHCLVRRALDVWAQIQRWVYWAMTFTPSWAIRCCTDLQGMTRSTLTPDAERQLRSQDMGTVVCLLAARSKQIRDGPRPCRQRRHLLLKDDLRRAA
jgi:putative transposase